MICGCVGWSEGGRESGKVGCCIMWMSDSTAIGASAAAAVSGVGVGGRKGHQSSKHLLTDERASLFLEEDQ